MDPHEESHWDVEEEREVEVQCNFQNLPAAELFPLAWCGELTEGRCWGMNHRSAGRGRGAKQPSPSQVLGGAPSGGPGELGLHTPELGWITSRWGSRGEGQEAFKLRSLGMSQNLPLEPDRRGWIEGV